MAKSTRRHKQWRGLLVPYVAESPIVEGVAGLIGLVGFLAGFFLDHGTSTATGTRWGTAFTIGLLTMLVAELFIERALGRTRRGRLERIEAALTDARMFGYVDLITDSYRKTVDNTRWSQHPDLYREVTANLLRGTEWSLLADQRLAIRDTAREWTVAQELLPTAAKSVRAIAIPSDLVYLDSESGLDYLNRQEARIDNDELEIRRLFVYSRYDRHHGDGGNGEIRAKIDEVAARHTHAGIKCRILCREDLPEGGREIPDLNIYDDHTVRFSTLQVGAGRMQSTISENEDDVRDYTQLFDSWWERGTRVKDEPREAGASGEEDREAEGGGST
jgi:hypothetical protein